MHSAVLLCFDLKRNKISLPFRFEPEMNSGQFGQVLRTESFLYNEQQGKNDDVTVRTTECRVPDFPAREFLNNLWGLGTE